MKQKWNGGEAMASKWEGNSQNHQILDFNLDLIMFGSSKQAMDLQNSESAMGQAMDHQDDRIPLWETPAIIQQIVFKMIFPLNNVLDIGRQTTTPRKCKDLQIPQTSPP